MPLSSTVARLGACLLRVWLRCWKLNGVEIVCFFARLWSLELMLVSHQGTISPQIIRTLIVRTRRLWDILPIINLTATRGEAEGFLAAAK